MKMSLNEQSFEIRAITEFPKPFREEGSPHHRKDFSEKTKEICRDGNESSKIFKIIVLGDVSVGKTCIVNRFCHQTFNSNYKATIGVDFEVELFTILGISFTSQIWDTAGQERFKCIAQSYYRGAHAIVVVFDMSSLLTLSNCETWLKEALEAGNTNESLIFLVGNKSDLLSQVACQNVEGLGIETAKQLHAEYWSVSAKTGENIQKMFFRMSALIFDTTMAKEKHTLRQSNGVHVGTDLVSLKKNSVNKKEKSKCNCNN